MKRGIWFLIFAAAIFVGLFELYLFDFLPQETTLDSYLSSAYASLVGPQSNKTIRINLYNKSLTLIENGGLLKQAKIAAAGRPGIAPTPVGSFKISLKDKRHISSISGLVMPLSLRFHGPYFLHGLPTTLSGRVIDTPYSNGCVRLPVGLDEEIFNWADIGAKVEIYNSALVKSDDALTVYYLTPEGAKEPISTPEEFIGRGFRWQDIETIPQIELDALPLAI